MLASPALSASVEHMGTQSNNGVVEFHISDDDMERLAHMVTERVVERLANYRDHYMTVAEAAVYLGFSQSKLHKLTAQRRIPFTQDGRGARCYFRKAELDAWRGPASTVNP